MTGHGVNLIFWQTRGDAEHAARHVNDIPEARAWFRHISQSRGLRHLEVIPEEPFAPADHPARPAHAPACPGDAGH
jgi:hypothetical protein